MDACASDADGDPFGIDLEKLDEYVRVHGFCLDFSGSDLFDGGPRYGRPGRPRVVGFTFGECVGELGLNLGEDLVENLDHARIHQRWFVENMEGFLMDPEELSRRLVRLQKMVNSIQRLVDEGRFHDKCNRLYDDCTIP